MKLTDEIMEELTHRLGKCLTTADFNLVSFKGYLNSRLGQVVGELALPLRKNFITCWCPHCMKRYLIKDTDHCTNPDCPAVKARTWLIKQEDKTDDDLQTTSKAW